MDPQQYQLGMSPADKEVLNVLIMLQTCLNL